MNRITANAAELMKQGPITADVYMNAAIKSIDEKFGEGYSNKNPELVSSYMKTCALDFATASITSALQDIACNKE